MKYLAAVSRFFVGIVFTFSGFVKIIDPLGTTYKFGDYFQDSFAMPGLDVLSFPMALLLCAAEFMMGIALILNLKPKIVSWLSLLFMIIFLPLTFYIAMVPGLKETFSVTFQSVTDLSDCGCFGDVLVMTNWQTFWKNMIIIIPVIIFFLYRKKAQPVFSNKKQWFIALGLAVVTVGFMMYNLMHLPVMDFRPYKKGNNITALRKYIHEMDASIPEEKAIMESVPEEKWNNKTEDIYYYKNLNTDEIEEFNSGNYPWEDTLNYEYYDFESKIISKGYEPPIHDFFIYSDEEDITESVLANERYFFLLVSYDINDASLKHSDRINEIADYCLGNGYGFIGLSASIEEHIDKFVQNTGANYKFYSMDEITLKTIVRSNPGLVLLKKGTIIDKWHHNDIPDLEKLKEKYLK